MKSRSGLFSAGLTICGGTAAIVRAAHMRLPVAGLFHDRWFVLAVAMTVVGAVLGGIALYRSRDALGALGLAAAVFGAIGSIIAHASVFEQYSHGRPFRRGKRPLTAAYGDSEGWLEEVTPGTLPPEPLRAELAAEWRRNGLKEHASIAAFSRLSLDLIAVSAPAALLAEVQSDALDERSVMRGSASPSRMPSTVARKARATSPRHAAAPARSRRARWSSRSSPSTP